MRSKFRRVFPFLPRETDFPREENLFSYGRKSIFMPMKILAVLKRINTKMRQSTSGSDASSPITY